MATPDERSRRLGALLCAATVLAGLLFLYGLAVESYWALALPVAAAFLFVLGLIFWIGFTIATVQVEASGTPLPVTPGPGSATTPEPASSPGPAGVPGEPPGPARGPSQPDRA